MQNNQLPTNSHVELEDKSDMLIVWTSTVITNKQERHMGDNSTFMLQFECLNTAVLN